MPHARPGRLALLAVAALAPLLARAGEAPSVPVGGAAARPALRWPEVAAAVAQHPSVLEAEARVRAADGAVEAAGAFPNPTFGLSAGEARPRGGGAGRREWGASVELPLDHLATRGPRVAAARAARDGAGQDALAARAEALRVLRRAFVAAAHGQAIVEADAALEAQAAELAALVRRRAERGEGRPIEAPRVEIELERLRAILEADRAAAEARRLRLELLAGRPVARVEDVLSLPIAIPPLTEATAAALAGSPAVRAAAARARAAEAEAGGERWARAPRLTVGGAHVEELDRTASTVTAAVTFPLTDWNGGRIRQADAAAEAERARAALVGRELAAALGDAWQACAAGQARARRFEAEILPRAERSARTLGRAFELGEAGLLDVIDARRVLLESRREHLDLLLDMQDACADLAALAGLELP